MQYCLDGSVFFVYGSTKVSAVAVDVHLTCRFTVDLNGEVLGVPVGRTEGQKQLVLTTLRSTLTDWKTISEIVSLPQKNIFFHQKESEMTQW